MSFDLRTFRNTLGLFVTGVTVITARDSTGCPVGITANSFNSVSLDPPLILWSVALNARSLGAFSEAQAFAVHILRDDQADLSQRFARSGQDKFAGLNIESGLHDVPLLPIAQRDLNAVRTRNTQRAITYCLLAEVERLISSPNAMPLVYHGGRYAELADKPIAPD